MGCGDKYIGEDGLVSKARDEIPVSNADTIELVIAGSSSIENSRLVWFISGNKNQAHTYTPIEFIESSDNQYEFVKTYKPIERITDISALMWKDGFSFIINNTDCCSVLITDSFGKSDNITVGELPFVYYFQGIPSEYSFVDKDGNVLN